MFYKPEGNLILERENSISESPDWDSVPKPKGVAVRTLGNERKVFIPGQGWQFPATARRWARAQGYVNWDKIPNPSQPPKPVPPPTKTPEPKLYSRNAEGKFYTGSKYGYQSWQTLKNNPSLRLIPDEALGSLPPEKVKPPVDPPTQQPTQQQPTQQQQPKKEVPPTQQQKPKKEVPVLRDKPLWDGPGDSSPKPQAQTGDRTKDLTTWANANKIMINTVGTPQQKAILSAAEKGTAMPAPRPISDDIADIKRMQTASRDRQGVEESYDAYDLVLEYLLSQGHTDTIEEAHYVMMEMDEEIIGNIIEHYIIE